MAFVIAGAIVATCGYIPLSCVVLNYLVVRGYTPGGERVVAAAFVVTAVGHGIFLWGKRKHPSLPYFIQSQDKKSRAEVDR